MNTIPIKVKLLIIIIFKILMLRIVALKMNTTEAFKKIKRKLLMLNNIRNLCSKRQKEIGGHLRQVRIRKLLTSWT